MKVITLILEQKTALCSRQSGNTKIAVNLFWKKL